MKSPSRQRCVLIYSGGLDSTVCLYHLKHAELDLHLLSFNYGQRHARELMSARGVSTTLLLPHQVVDMSYLGSQLLKGSSQTDPTIDVPEGHYTDESMKATVVPNRNMIMLSLAAGYAISQGIDRIAYAAHAGDHAIYPDCRPEFINSITKTLTLVHFEPIRLLAPFTEWTKAMIVKRGSVLNVPFELTYSCYKGGEKHCGKCGTCVERKEAFKLAGVEDPTPYEN